MNFNQKLEKLLDFSLEDYPSSAYSLIEARQDGRSKFPKYFSYRYPQEPIYEFFEKIEVDTHDNLKNRNIFLVTEKFELSQIEILRRLVESLVDIYGADEKRNLWLNEDEEEEIRMNQWEGRYWNFPNNEEIRDVSIHLEGKRLSLAIYERGTLLDFE
jgi:hypothetical protein